MKAKYLLITSAIIFMFASCQKEGLKVTFNMPANEIQFTVAKNPQFGEMSFVQKDLEYNLDSCLKQYSIPSDKITSVKIKSVYFDVMAPSTATFDIVDWVQSYVGPAGNPSNLIAEKNPVSKDKVTSIGLDIKDVELVSYVKSGKLAFMAKGKTNAPVTEDIPLRVKVVLQVQGQVVN